MQSNWIERWFIRVMTHTYPDLVERRLEASSKILESQKITQKNRWVILVISLLRYINLIIEFLIAHFRPAPQTEALLFWEIYPQEIVGRLKFLKWNKPNAEFESVSYADKLCFVPNILPVWRIMFRLLITILVSALYKPSQLTPHLVRIVRTTLLTFGRAYASTNKTIYLFEIYRIETPFVAAFLMEHGIRVHLIASSAPLSFDNRILIGDSLEVCDPYQVDEFAYYRSMGTCKSCELWSPETFYRLEARYKGLTIDNHFDTIGVYTSGILLRDQLGSLNKEFAAKAIEREIELSNMVAAYARDHPEINVIIFPHPMERRHYHKTGEYPFSKHFKVSNIEVDLSGVGDSTLQFDRVGLGLTNFSSIGFERIHLGFRTIFYVADLEYINWEIESPYHQIFFTERAAFLSAIDQVRQMPHHDFMNHYFGHFFQTLI